MSESDEVLPMGFYPQVIVDQIIERVANGESVTHICGEPMMPSKVSFYRWLGESKELQARYSAAVSLSVANRVYRTAR